MAIILKLNTIAQICAFWFLIGVMVGLALAGSTYRAHGAEYMKLPECLSPGMQTFSYLNLKKPCILHYQKDPAEICTPKGCKEIHEQSI